MSSTDGNKNPLSNIPDSNGDILSPSTKIKGYTDRPATAEWKERKKEVFRRDKYTCRFCGKKALTKAIRSKILTIDHIVPISRGGNNNKANLVCACKKCNNKKGNRIIEPLTLKQIEKGQVVNLSFIKGEGNSYHE